MSQYESCFSFFIKFEENTYDRELFVWCEAGGQDRDTFLSKKMTLQLKGIAILMVFASHIPQVANLPTGVANLLAPMGYHGVAIFLFLSGYGCYISLEKNQDIAKFIEKRARAILPSLIVATVIAAIVE